MNNKTKYIKGSQMTWPSFLNIKTLALIALVLLGIQSPLQAQETQYTRPSWYFGLAGGANFNFYRGSTQTLNSSLTSPVAFHDGDGIGLFMLPLVEYRPIDSNWGVMFQAGYDNRKGKFDQVMSPCNCPADLSANMSYITVEPSLRFAPFQSGFYLFAGPRLAFNMEKSFKYQLGTNPDYPNQTGSPRIDGDFDNVKKTIFSMQIGLGYDIPLSSKESQNQFELSPFISFHPYFGQHPRSTETWNITTARAGVALKFGRGKRIETSGVVYESQFSIDSPNNTPVTYKANEVFPLRNYVFFNVGSTAIPNRYELLRKGQVKDFKEDQLKVTSPKNLSERSKRQMTVYYNILNILGVRMQQNPSTSITLVGSSEKGPDDGRAMANTIKVYLVDVFSIDSSRIKVEGRTKPSIPSEKPGGTRELELLREGDQRVSIESNSPVLLMEFQSGPNAPLKPVVITYPTEAPIESYVTFNNAGAKEGFKSWSLELKDENGKVQAFGPYTEDKASISGKSILGNRTEGHYTAKMIGITKTGELSVKEAPVHVKLWSPNKVEQGIRYSIIYEFDESTTINIYEKYLSEIITPKIPIGATVIIKGYTDIIGGEVHNQELSLARANDVKTILENSLSKVGRKDVKFQVNGFGEGESASPFENKTPEERFYNRTVIIDVIPLT
ncbi:OmpA family protein [Flavobacterium sp.]|uniref:OmpA family protein n=1 Tax=Flavobacterium sp. TaxID=239 RepID=UPI0026166ADB|nr:OmpA family protein [Flavobacterium sp.]